jgi:Caudovirales tail fibre assembly protein.
MYFSPSKVAFYDGDLEAAYKSAGSWPSDAVPITDAAYQTFVAQPPAGKVLGASGSAPAWVDAPAPTLAQQAAAALGAGLTITSTGTPALNGTYAVASGVPFGREDIGTEAQFISTFSEFTNGTQTLSGR